MSELKCPLKAMSNPKFTNLMWSDLMLSAVFFVIFHVLYT